MRPQLQFIVRGLRARQRVKGISSSSSVGKNGFYDETESRRGHGSEADPRLRPQRRRLSAPPDAGHPGQHRGALEPNTEAPSINVNSLIQRGAGTSLSRIENLSTRKPARPAACRRQRGQREISGYAQLSQAA